MERHAFGLRRRQPLAQRDDARGLRVSLLDSLRQLALGRLEARLEEIDGAVQAYSKDKVFVPADM